MNRFRSTTESQNGFSSAANYGGRYSAVAVAATHGHKKVLNLLVSHALTSSPEVSSAGNGTDQVVCENLKNPTQNIRFSWFLDHKKSNPDLGQT